MNDPQHPPIASPDGTFNPLPPVPSGGGDWKNAPPIVRGWAYPLTWLGIIILPLVIIYGLSNSQMGVARFAIALLYVVLFGVDIWLIRALKRGDNPAWTGQIVLSCFGLLAFPLGTAIHGYILSQWFKPATKAWFNQS